MFARSRLAGLIVLIGIPLVVGVLWLASGGEVFSKSGKPTAVTVRDPLFGDTLTETQIVRGPVLGYYVGLDLLLLTLLLALVAGATWWLLARRRRRSHNFAKDTPT